MERSWTSALGTMVGRRVRLSGWLHRFRRQSTVSFLIVRDATGLAQVVVEDPAVVEQLAGLYSESVLSITGIAVARPEAPGGVEVHEPVVEVLAAASEPPPFDLFRPVIKAQLPTILDHAPIGLRHPRHRALFQLAAALTHGFRATLRGMSFTEIHTPKLVAGATESGADVFPVAYFGLTAYLAQSPRFYNQIMVGVFERVFEAGPVFRAEPHDTPRHLNEYVSLDAETGFITDRTSVMTVLTRVLAGMMTALGEEAPEALRRLELVPPAVPAAIPPSISPRPWTWSRPRPGRMCGGRRTWPPPMSAG